MAFPCIICSSEVRPRQEAVQCDECGRWQHRTCRTGILRSDYRAAVKLGVIEWVCFDCRLPRDVVTAEVNNAVDDNVVTAEVHHAVEVQNAVDENVVTVEVQNEVDENVVTVEVQNEVEVQNAMDEVVALLVEDIETVMDEGAVDVSNEETANEVDEVAVFIEVNDVPIVNAPVVYLLASDLPAFEDPVDLNESEVEIVVPTPVITEDPDDGRTTYTIVEGGTNKGKDLLVDSNGYQYTVKVDKRRSNIVWRCCIRNGPTICRATVGEADGHFTPGMRGHICNSATGRVQVAELRRDVKREAGKRVFDSAAEIVEELRRQKMTPAQLLLCPTLPAPAKMARQANDHRKNARPQDPKDLEFILDENHITPGFFRRDIRVGAKRHIMLASDDMLHHLGRTYWWFMDATFRVVRAPFTQLFSIHGFATSGPAIKQIPLVFIIMSGKRTDDYAAVFSAVLELVHVRVVRATADFELAMWQGLRRSIPHIKIIGCLFHFTQAVYRKIQEVGLKHAYGNDTGTTVICRDLMTLPVLPHPHITPMFETVAATVPEDNEPLTRVINYFRDTWINGHLFSPADWSVYKLDVRTNNDVEGWHYRLNKRGKKACLPFYLLCELLATEAHNVEMALVLVHNEDLSRQQRNTAKHVNEELTKLWEQYSRLQRSPRSLLTKASFLICPKPETTGPAEVTAEVPAEVTEDDV